MRKPPDSEDAIKLKRDSSSFPVTLTADDLPRLNAHIDELAYMLSLGDEAFRELGDGGRHGMVFALAWTKAFLDLFEPIGSKNFTQSLAVLQNALHALDDNNILPALTPTRRTGRAPASHLNILIRAKAVQVTEQIFALGVPLQEAYGKVAETLCDCGFKSGRGSVAISGDTVRGWKETVGKDVNREKSLSQYVVLFRHRAEADQRQRSKKLPEKAAVDRLLNELRRHIPSARPGEIF